MQPNDNIFIDDQECDPEQINGIGINLPDENDDDDNNLSTLSYEYMIYSDDDDDDSLSSDNENDNNNTLSTIEKYRKKITTCKRLQNNDDITAKDYVSQKPDVLIKYIKILLKDAVQKERKIKRLQAEFDQRSREVADLKDIYEKLIRKR